MSDTSPLPCPVATHEAAHIATALHLGLVVKHAYFRAIPGAAGGYVTVRGPDPPTADNVCNHITAVMAGDAAQRLAGVTVRPLRDADGLDADARDVARWLRVLCGADEALTSAWRRHLERRAVEVLRRPEVWRAVLVLARALEARGSLRREDIAELWRASQKDGLFPAK